MRGWFQGDLGGSVWRESCGWSLVLGVRSDGVDVACARR